MKKIKLLLLFVVATAVQSLFALDAPNFTVTNYAGVTKNLYTDYLNQNKTVVIKLFFTQCPPCQQIAPQVQTLYQQWGSGGAGVEFISLAIYAGSANNNVAVHNYDVQYNQTFLGFGHDGGSIAASQPYTSGQFGVFEGTPTFIVIAPNKSVQFYPHGNTQTETIAAVNAAILATGKVKPSAFYVSGRVSALNGNNCKTAITNWQINPNSSGSVGLDSLTGRYKFKPDSTLTSGVLTLGVSKNDNVRDGISTIDIIQIQKHILGISLLSSPYKLIAADVSKSGAITGFDIIELRKIILYITDTFPNNKSWRFIDSRYAFPDPTNPWTMVFPEIFPPINLPLTSNIDTIDFVGVKIGDVNLSGSYNCLTGGNTEEHSAAFGVATEDRALKAGEEFTVSLAATENETLEGLQLNFEVNIDLAEIKQVNSESLKNFNQNSWNQRQNNIYISWSEVNQSAIEKEKPLITVTGRAKQNCLLSQVLSLSQNQMKSELYNDKNETRSVGLSYASENLKSDDFLVSPNPVGDLPAELTVRLDSDASISVVVFDILGRPINTVFEGIAKAGINKFELSSSDWRGGNYFVKITTSGKISKTLKVTKI